MTVHVHPALEGLRSLDLLPDEQVVLHPDRLAAVTGDVAARPELWRHLVRHDPERRWYERLLRTDAVEVWLIGWAPGQSTGPHDHAGATGALTVVEGALVEELYRQGDLTVSDRIVHATGGGTRFDGRHVHRVGNQGAANATSIHAYSPPDRPMRRHPLPMNVDDVLARSRAGLRRVDVRAAADELRRGALLVDIRPEAQRRREGEIDGALVIDRNVLEWRLDPTSQWRVPEVTGHDQRVLVICQEGYSSSLAAATLRELGLDATDVIGGFEAWVEAGLATGR